MRLASETLAAASTFRSMRPSVMESSSRMSRSSSITRTFCLAMCSLPGRGHNREDLQRVARGGRRCHGRTGMTRVRDGFGVADAEDSLRYPRLAPASIKRHEETSHVFFRLRGDWLLWNGVHDAAGRDRLRRFCANQG